MSVWWCIVSSYIYWTVWRFYFCFCCFCRISYCSCHISCFRITVIIPCCYCRWAWRRCQCRILYWYCVICNIVWTWSSCRHCHSISCYYSRSIRIYCICSRCCSIWILNIIFNYIFYIRSCYYIYWFSCNAAYYFVSIIIDIA